MALETRDYMSQLRRQLAEHFALVDLRLLVTDLDLDWDDLPGQQLADKAQALVTYLGKRGQLADLVTLLCQAKPAVAWPQLPSREEQIADAHSPSSDEVFEEAFQNYLAQISELLHGENLWTSSGNVRSAFATETLAAFSSLDAKSKGQLIRFLHDTKLLGESTVIHPDGAEFHRANLSAADLRGVDLAGANLTYADLSKAKLRGANLSRANLGGADLWGADLTGANLKQSHLWGANLNKANLRRANLAEARLSQADLWGANLSEANLDGAYLWQANLKDVILVGVRNVTLRQLRLASSTEGAILPSGMQ